MLNGLKNYLSAKRGFKRMKAKRRPKLEKDYWIYRVCGEMRQNKKIRERAESGDLKKYFFF